jgi:hypothetical protein
MAWLLAAALAGAASPGCFVGDELNKSAELAAGKARAVGDEGKPAEAKQVAKAGGDPPERPTGDAWWKTAVTLGSEESDAGIVGCKLGGRVEFMQRDDCLTRGGAPE